MEIILIIKVFSPNNEGLTYTKNYTSSMIPSVGDKVKDSLFAKLRMIASVSYDFKLDQCHVELVSEETTDERLEGHMQEVAELHNWKELKKEE